MKATTFPHGNGRRACRQRGSLTRAVEQVQDENACHESEFESNADVTTALAGRTAVDDDRTVLDDDTTAVHDDATAVDANVTGVHSELTTPNDDQSTPAPIDSSCEPSTPVPQQQISTPPDG